MSGAAKKQPSSGYKFGNKNQWRRWIWNRIAERLIVPAKEAIAIYLPGPTDLDRAEALRRGFRPLNLLTIDRDDHLVRSHRLNGMLSIGGDFVDFLMAWNPNRRAHVIFGDFCSGLEARYVKELGGAPLQMPFKDAVWAFNFMRGRDKSSSAFRDCNNGGTARMIERFWPTISTKHRGAQFLLWHLISHLGNAIHAEAIDQNNPNEIVSYWDGLSVAVHPSFYSYRSTSGQIFDSCVFSYAGITRLLPDDLANDEVMVQLKTEQEAIGEWKRVVGDSDTLSSMVRQTAAVLAHRTRRLG